MAQRVQIKRTAKQKRNLAKLNPNSNRCSIGRLKLYYLLAILLWESVRWPGMKWQASMRLRCCQHPWLSLARNRVNQFLASLGGSIEDAIVSSHQIRLRVRVISKHAPFVWFEKNLKNLSSNRSLTGLSSSKPV